MAVRGRLIELGFDRGRHRLMMKRVQSAMNKLFTVNDYRMMPEGLTYCQIIAGGPIESPSPNRLHQVVARNVFRVLDDYLRRNPIGDACFAPMDVFLSETDVVQPDMLVVLNVNRSLLADDGVHGGPDLVVEIVSP